VSDAPRDRSISYVRIRSPRGVWKTRAECAALIEKGEADFLLSGSGARHGVTGSGRGPIVRFCLAGRRAVGKRCLRGGLLGPLLGGLYLGEGRALRQVEAAARLQRAGVPTPDVLAAGSRRAACLFRAQAVVTRELAGAQNLLDLAPICASRLRRRGLLLMCADLVRAMHQAGFLHADLNVSNLVLERGPDGEILNVLDLDGGRFVVELSTTDRFRNLARLLRSYEKWIAERVRLTPREEVLFLRRYCGHERDRLRELLGRLARYRARLTLRRISWRMSAGARSGGRSLRPRE